MKSKIKQYCIPEISPLEAETYRRLKAVGGEAAEFFRDACVLLREDPPRPSASALVSHLIREIEATLRSRLLPLDTDLEVKDREERKQKLTALLKENGYDASSIGRMVHQIDGEGHLKQVRKILSVLNISKSHPAAATWTRFADQKVLHGFAHRSNAHRPRPIKVAKDLFEQAHPLIHFIAGKTEERFLTVLEEIDTIKDKPPGRKVIEQLKERIPLNSVTMEHLFVGLNKDWAIPLHKKGFFDDPPEPEEDSERGTTTLIRWDQSRYLAAIAKEAPQVVHDIALSIRVTGNPRVHLDLIEAACAMPANLAKDFVPLAVHAIKTPNSSCLLPERLVTLIKLLATNETKDSAFDLARETLALKRKPDTHRVGRDLLSNIDESHYRKSCVSIVKALATIDPKHAIDLLIELLKAAGSVQRSSKVPRDDGSRYWYPRVGSGSERDLRSVLATSLFKLCSEQIESDSGQLQPLLQLLQKQQPSVFHRIALELGRTVARNGGNPTASLILDKRYLYNTEVEREYLLLLEAAFQYLEDRQKTEVLDRIKTTLPIKAGGGSDPEKIERYNLEWRRNVLSVIEKHLDPSTKEEFNRLVQKLGPPEPIPSNSFVMVGRGERQTSIEDLRSQKPAELVQYLQERPSRDQDFFADTPIEAFRELVTESPSLVLENQKIFLEIPPFYLKGAVWAFDDLIKEKDVADPDAVLSFLLAVWDKLQISLSSADRNREHLSVLDPIISAFHRAVASDIAEMRSKGRDALAKLSEHIENLMKDASRQPASCLQEESKWIHDVAGRAVESLILYCSWLNKETDAEHRDSSRQRMYEILELIVSLTSPSRFLEDISLAVGKYIARLVVIDRKWLMTRIEQLLPTEQLTNGQSPLWKAFLKFNGPYKDFIELFEPHYFAALAAKNVEADYLKSLSYHIAVFFLRGNIEIDHRIVATTLSSPNNLRALVIQKVGRALEESEEQLPDEVIARAEQLFQNLVQIYEKGGLTGEEVSFCSRWITSGQLPAKLLLQLLDWLIANRLRFENVGGVLASLNEIYDQSPLAVINSTLSLCRTIADDMQFFYSKEDLTSLIQKIVDDNYELREAGETLRNYLSSRGLHIKVERKQS